MFSCAMIHLLLSLLESIKLVTHFRISNSRVSEILSWADRDLRSPKIFHLIENLSRVPTLSLFPCLSISRSFTGTFLIFKTYRNPPYIFKLPLYLFYLSVPVSRWEITKVLTPMTALALPVCALMSVKSVEKSGRFAQNSRSIYALILAPNLLGVIYVHAPSTYLVTSDAM